MKVGRIMLVAWEGKATAKDVVQTALNCLVHPVKSDWMKQTVNDWLEVDDGINREKVQQASDRHALERRANEMAEELQKDIAKWVQFMATIPQRAQDNVLKQAQEAAEKAVLAILEQILGSVERKLEREIDKMNPLNWIYRLY